MDRFSTREGSQTAARHPTTTRPQTAARPLMSQSFHQTGGWIEVIAGVMFSGKSEELLRRVRRAIIARKRVQVFKSRLDERYSGIYTVSSHDGRTFEAIPADSCPRCCKACNPR